MKNETTTATKEIDTMTMNKMRRDLERIELEACGSKAVLKERLRAALTKNGAGNISSADREQADALVNQTRTKK